MKKLFLTATSVVVVSMAQAQVNPRGEASFSGDEIVIDYGRPSAKGRDVLSMAEPGSYWRLGADQATKMTTKVDVLFGDSRVAAGEYTPLGHFLSDDAGRVRAVIIKGQEYVEQMTIEIDDASDGGDIVLSWGSNRIRMPFKVAP